LTGAGPQGATAAALARAAEARVPPPGAASVPWTDLACVVACAGFVSAWCASAAGAGPSARLFVAALGAFGTFYAVGTLAWTSSAASEGIAPSFPARLLAGFTVVNTALFVVAAAHLPALRGTALTIGAGATAALAWICRRTARAAPPERLPALLATGFSLVAATLLAQDTIRPTEVAGATTVFRPWVDAFFHVAQIARIGEVHGGAMEDVMLAGFPARLYHYAPYVTPALLKAIGGVSAYGAYGGALVPLGVLLTGLAAYVLVASWWGPWPGFAATVALLALPDAAAQGARNSYLSYHWLQGVGPAGLYGVALLALAWTLVLRGCAHRSAVQLLAGWSLGACTLAYKAQLFVAASLLLWIYPALAMRGVRPLRRAAWLVGSLVAYLGAVRVAGRSASFPVMRLDGSAAAPFLRETLLPNQAPGAFRAFFEPHLMAGSQRAMLAWGAVYVVGAAIGLFAVAYPLLVGHLRRRVEARVLAWPALVIASFAVAAVGLAFDDRGIGTRDELLHRPFVWAYFVAATWVGGAVALAVLSNRRRACVVKALLVAASALLLVVPAARGARGVQAKPGWSLARVEVPTALVRVADWLRTHAAPDDVVQDAHGDPRLALAALSDRRPFVVRFWMRVRYGQEEIATRSAELDSLLRASSEEELRALAVRTRIRWIVLHPGDAPPWPPAFVARPAFESSGFRAYRLD